MATKKRAKTKKVSKKVSKKTTKKKVKAAAPPHPLEGKKAPSFALKDFEASTHRLADKKSKYTVLFFYPKDNTPGCTIESVSFSKNLKKFESLNAEVIGVSGGDEKSKSKFIDKHNLKVLLVSDGDFKVAKKFKSYGKKQFMGRTFDGIFRYTFVLDKSKKIIRAFTKVKPDQHVQEVLDYLKTSP